MISDDMPTYIPLMNVCMHVICHAILFAMSYDMPSETVCIVIRYKTLRYMFCLMQAINCFRICVGTHVI